MTIFDTSAVLDMLRRKSFELGSISAITLIEVIRGLSSEKRKAIKRLLEESFEVLYLDNDTVLEYCRLYESLKKKGELLPDADLLVAATASARGEELVTKERHFSKLAELGVKVKLL